MYLSLTFNIVERGFTHILVSYINVMFDFMGGNSECDTWEDIIQVGRHHTGGKTSYRWEDIIQVGRHHTGGKTSYG